MLKRITVAVAAFFALTAQVFAAGTIPWSLSQQLDEFGNPLANCFLYLIQAGTVSTPQNGYQDSGLTLVLPNPMRCDAAGRLPQFFLADGSIKVRLTKSNGVNVVTADGILVVGASSGGGGGSPVDATTVLATGDVKVRYGTGVLTGFVRMNGRTIGSATSGATERANADAQALFEYLWGADANLVVSTGRGATANADWVANKTLTLPDMRGRGLWALDDMGNSAAGNLSNTCGSPTLLGFKCGGDARTIAVVNLPNYALTSTLGVSSSLAISDTRVWQLAETNGLRTYNGVNGDEAFGGTGSLHSFINRTVNVASGAISLTGGLGITGGVSSGGSGTPLPILPPAMLLTIYVKL